MVKRVSVSVLAVEKKTEWMRFPANVKAHITSISTSDTLMPSRAMYELGFDAGKKAAVAYVESQLSLLGEDYHGWDLIDKVANALEGIMEGAKTVSVNGGMEMNIDPDPLVVSSFSCTEHGELKPSPACPKCLDNFQK